VVRQPDADEPVLVVVDYPGRRSSARVADLGLADLGFTVHSVLEPPGGREVAAHEYARALLEEHGPFPRAAAVLAYCMAAPVGQELAALLSRGRTPVPMILFDGRPATVDAVIDQYRVAAGQLQTQLGGRRRAVEQSAPDRTLLENDPRAALAEMERSLTGLGMAALSDGSDGSAGADALDDRDVVDEVVSHFMDWLAHLLAAYHWPRSPWGGAVLHVMSSAHNVSGPWPGAGSTEEVRIDAPRVELLSTASARQTVLEYLGRVDSPV
jgi:hypothetical protein